MKNYFQFMPGILTITCIIILLLLPADLFDKGETLCLITRITGIHCYGCGMTRAIMHLIHFDFSQAWQYNKLSFIVLPLLCYLAFIKVIGRVSN